MLHSTSINLSRPVNYFIGLVLFFALMIPANAQVKMGEEMIKSMHKRYYGAPCKTYSFSQKNTHYRNDSVVGHSEWFEVVSFPDKFRIDFGNKADSNFVVFRNDSVYNYKAGKCIKQKPDSNMLLLLLGGMYYRDIKDVFARMKAKGYDLSLLSLQMWNNEEVYVIGAKENDYSKNQIWVSKSSLRVLRILEHDSKGTRDMRFEAHQNWCNGYVENKVSFRRNGELEQLEEYYDIKEVSSFPKN